MACITEYNSARSSSSCVKDIYAPNIAAINRNEPGEWKRYYSKKHCQLTSMNFLKEKHCNTSIAFMRLKDPKHHSEGITYCLAGVAVIQWTRRRQSGIMKKPERKAMMKNKKKQTRRSRFWHAIERAIEFEKQKQKEEEEESNQQLTDWKLEKERRRSLHLTLQNLEFHRGLI